MPLERGRATRSNPGAAPCPRRAGRLWERPTLPSSWLLPVVCAVCASVPRRSLRQNRLLQTNRFACSGEGRGEDRPEPQSAQADICRSFRAGTLVSV